MTGNLNGIYVIWLRDVKKFFRDKPRMIGATVQPALYLLLLGTGLSRGLSPLRQGSGGGSDNYLHFIFPGIIAMTLLFTSVFSAISIVWDREVGFLKEVLVAPISRWAVAVGKTVGGSTVAMFQGCLMLVFAPLIHLSLSWVTVAALIPAMFFISFTLTAMGIVIASRMRSMQGFTLITNFIMLPMFFLSGAMFPTDNLPPWMSLLVILDPLTYGVDLLRNIILSAGPHSYLLCLNILALFGATMIVFAINGFSKTE
ncbi:MAG TPA: ABC transporter permease [Nitrospiria bacterium]|nr:ABC transporter permease [Nitrospiria bacterium]